MIKISWRFGNHATEQARFCLGDCMNGSVRLCEASFFANGTLRATRTFETEIMEACHACGRCKNISNRTDMKFINVSWSATTQAISCELYGACVETFFVVTAHLFNETGAKVDEVVICPHDTIYKSKLAYCNRYCFTCSHLTRT